jgi:hypothetical protein
MRKIVSLVVVLAAIGAGAGGPAPAQADDRSVKAAWDSADARFAELGRSARREERRWRRRGYTRDGRLLRIFRQSEALTKTVEQRVAAESSSSAKGAEAKAWALRSLRTFAAFFRSQQRLVRLTRPNATARERRERRRSAELDRRTRRQADRGLALFREAGVD